MTRVLIAADDSEESVTAARAALVLFGDDATYTVVSVASERNTIWSGSAMEWGVPYPMAVPPAGTFGPPLVFPQPTTDAPIATAGELAERQADQVAVAADLPHAEVVGQVGDPTDAIIDAAARCHADVIVVGSHDRNWFQRLLSPSVADAVVHDARVPVLVVHAR